VKAEIERTNNLMLMEDVAISLLLDGSWTQQTGGWHGYSYGGLENLVDDDLRTCNAYFKSTNITTYYEYFKIDLGEVKTLGRLNLFAMGPRNLHRFPNGITVKGSVDDSPGSYVELSPGTIEREIIPGDADPLVLDDLVYNSVRYLKIWMRACKWIKNDDGGAFRQIGLSEIRIFETEEITVEAKIQDTDANGGWTLPDGTFISTYYPDLVSKTYPYGYVTLIIEDENAITDIQALDRAHIELNEAIRHYQAVEVAVPFDPRINLFQTVQIADDYFPGGVQTLRFLVEEITHAFGETNLIGIDYSGGVLE
jgi:hypothetical protein